MTSSKNRRKKGRSAFGFTRQLPSGNWQASYVDKDGVRRNAARTFADTEADRHEMRLWLAGKELSYLSGDGTQHEADREQAVRRGKGLTLGQFAESWIESRIIPRTGSKLSPRTRSEYHRLLESENGLRSLAGHRLQGITKKTVREWFSEVSRAGNGSSNATQAARAYSLLKAILGTAVEEDLVPFNPCSIRGAGNMSSNIKKDRSLASIDELTAILGNLNEYYQTLVRVAALGGLRWGEITALKRKDLDLSGDLVVVSVRRGVTYLPGEGFVEGPTKNKETREVHLPAGLTGRLIDHLDSYVGAEKEALVFPSTTGSYLAESTMSRHWYRAREGAGRDDLTFHDLRHFAATLYGMVPGVTEKELLTRIGHKSREASWIYQHTTGREVEMTGRMEKLPGVDKLL